jgi:CubicO group peptidase (beta-lactamase class C family)
MDPKELSRRVDALFRAWSHKEKTPGAAICVMRGGKLLHQGCYGCANIEKQTPITPQSRFLLASLTKPFTALLVMKLVAEGSLAYDQRLSEFFPEFSDYARRITVRHLLLDTSGLREFEDIFKEACVVAESDWYPRPEDTKPSPKEPTSRETLEFLSRQRQLLFEPGDRFEYSNSGYVVLGQLVEKLSRQPFPTFIKSAIFEPAEMKDSTVPVAEWRELPNRVKSYAQVEGGFENRDYTPFNQIYGEDGIYASIEDMARWDQALLTNQLVSQSSLQAAFTPGKLNSGYPTPTGFGWFIGPDLVDHSGAWQGFQTYVRRYRSRRLTIIVLANCQQIDAAWMGELISRIYLQS